MKKLFTLACVAMLAVSASAQITWNAKLGLGFASCPGLDEGNTSLHFVGKAGVGIEYPLSDNLSLMPSLEFAAKGTKFDNSEYAEIIKETVDIYYLQVPVMAAYRLNLNDDWNLTVKAGPYFAYGLFGSIDVTYTYNGQTKNENVDMDFDDTINRFDCGIDVGVDFEHHRFVFGLEYERGFTNMVKNAENAEYTPTIYNQAFYATVGYKF